MCVSLFEGRDWKWFDGGGIHGRNFRYHLLGALWYIDGHHQRVISEVVTIVVEEHVTRNFPRLQLKVDETNPEMIGQQECWTLSIE